MATATIQDVETRLGRELDTDEQAQVTALLADAELLIRSRVDIASVDQDILVMVESNAVLRVIKNPNGYLQESDGNYSYSVSAKVASGKLDILAEEWALLGVKSGVYTISTVPQMPWLERPSFGAGG